MNRDSDDISSIVSGLREDLNELKTKQFTSQPSGMTFAVYEEETQTFDIPENPSDSRLTIIRIESIFATIEARPALVLPTMDFSAVGYDIVHHPGVGVGEEELDFNKDGETKFAARLGLFKNRLPSYSGSYNWETVLTLTNHPAFQLTTKLSGKGTARGGCGNNLDVYIV